MGGAVLVRAFEIRAYLKPSLARHRHSILAPDAPSLARRSLNCEDSLNLRFQLTQRNRLLKRARDYEAVVTLGCDSALYTVQEVLKNTECQVIQGMQMIGTTNATLKVRIPMTVELDMHCVVKNGRARQHKTTLVYTAIVGLLVCQSVDRRNE